MKPVNACSSMARHELKKESAPLMGNTPFESTCAVGVHHFLVMIIVAEIETRENLRAFDFHGIQGTRVQPKRLENCRGHLHGFDGTKDSIPFK